MYFFSFILLFLLNERNLVIVYLTQNSIWEISDDDLKISGILVFFSPVYMGNVTREDYI